MDPVVWAVANRGSRTYHVEKTEYRAACRIRLAIHAADISRTHDVPKGCRKCPACNNLI